MYSWLSISADSTPQNWQYLRDSLMVQWLGIRASTTEGTGSIPSPGTKIPHVADNVCVCVCVCVCVSVFLVKYCRKLQIAKLEFATQATSYIPFTCLLTSIPSITLKASVNTRRCSVLPIRAHGSRPRGMDCWAPSVRRGGIKGWKADPLFV